VIHVADGRRREQAASADAAAHVCVQPPIARRIAVRQIGQEDGIKFNCRSFCIPLFIYFVKARNKLPRPLGRGNLFTRYKKGSDSHCIYTAREGMASAGPRRNDQSGAAGYSR
jgi:hypothetical protein